MKTVHLWQAALAAVLWHVILSTNVGDDMVYFKTLLDGNSSLGEILAHRYETWSSRMVIEAVLIPLVHCPLLWKILDIVIFTSLPVLLCGLLGVTGARTLVCNRTGAALSVCDVASAGWIATTTNYLWPLWGVLVIGMVLKQLRAAEKCRCGRRQLRFWRVLMRAARNRLRCCCFCCLAWKCALYLGKAYETAASLCIVRHRYYFPHIYFQLSGKCNPERAGDGGENAGVC